MKVGRNELCPCGSGKKYKKCHMNKESELEELKVGLKNNALENLLEDEDLMYNIINGMRDFILKDEPHIKEYKKIRKLHGEIIDNMFNYYEEGKFEPKFNLEGVKEKINLENIKYMNTSFDTTTQLGQQALLNILIYKNSSTANCITEEYLEKHKFRKPEKVEFLNAMLNSKAGLFEITKNDEKNGQVYLNNVLSNEEYCITDIALSGSPNNDKFYLYNRIITYNNISFGTGVGLIFEKTDKFIKNWIKENKKKYDPKEELVRFLELYNEYQKDDKGNRIRINEI